MRTPYLLDANNADYVRGKASEPPGTALWIILLLTGIPTLLTVLGLVFGVMAFNDSKHWLALEEDSLVTTAHYTWLPRLQFGQTGDAVGVEYQFVVDDHTYAGSHSIPAAVLMGIHKGDPVEIRYLADDPEVSGPVGASFPTGFPMVTGILLCIAAVFGFVAYSLLWGGAKNRRKWRAARVVLGEVVSAEVASQEDSKGKQSAAGETPAHSLLILTYAFNSPQSGQAITKKQNSPPTTPEAPLPKPGQAVAIRFLDDDNYHLM